MPEVVLTIGGSDSGGGAGIQADIKTFSALGLHGTSVITAVTAQNTLGVQGVFGLPSEAVFNQLQSVTCDFRVAYAKTGMLYSPDTVNVVAQYLREEKIPIILDPVIEAEAGGRLLRPEAVVALKEMLIPLARVVTPNIFEAQALTGIRVKDIASAKTAARMISEMGAKAVVVKGGHLDCTDLMMVEGEVQLFKGPRVEGGNHGVGCTYSAALTSFLALEYALEEAALLAKNFAAQAISNSINVGRGVSPVNQSGTLRRDAERFRALCNVDRAIEILMDDPDSIRLIPKGGINIAMAIPEATHVSDVAAVDGRLVRTGTRVYPSGCVKFGASSHVARVILAAMKFDPRCRAGMNISPNASEACSALGMETAQFDFDYSKEQLKTDAISCIVAHAVKKAGRVPDAISISGEHSIVPMIILIGASATSVAANALNLAKLSPAADGKI
jgi:hydroxymethylpyrimidine kinase / phosphomethylpyrimidine kinase / thiamine-phosphate diphosphorylase